MKFILIVVLFCMLALVDAAEFTSPLSALATANSLLGGTLLGSHASSLTAKLAANQLATYNEALKTHAKAYGSAVSKYNEAMQGAAKTQQDAVSKAVKMAHEAAQKAADAYQKAQSDMIDANNQASVTISKAHRDILDTALDRPLSYAVHPAIGHALSLHGVHPLAGSAHLAGGLLHASTLAHASSLSALGGLPASLHPATAAALGLPSVHPSVQAAYNVAAHSHQVTVNAAGQVLDDGAGPATDHYIKNLETEIARAKALRNVAKQIRALNEAESKHAHSYNTKLAELTARKANIQSGQLKKGQVEADAEGEDEDEAGDSDEEDEDEEEEEVDASSHSKAVQTAKLVDVSQGGQGRFGQSETKDAELKVMAKGGEAREEAKEELKDDIKAEEQSEAAEATNSLLKRKGETPVAEHELESKKE